MKTRSLSIFILLICTLAFIVLHKIQLQHSADLGRWHRETPEPSNYGPAPHFKLTKADGTELNSTELFGKVWTINFFFTSCPETCPVISPRIAKLQNLYVGKDVKFVSVTVDPKRDTLEKLREYQKKYGANPQQWIAARSDSKAEIIELATKGLRLMADENPMMHSPSFALVDKKGMIRGYFRGTEEESMAKLEGEILELLKE